MVGERRIGVCARHWSFLWVSSLPHPCPPSSLAFFHRTRLRSSCTNSNVPIKDGVHRVALTMVRGGRSEQRVAHLLLMDSTSRGASKQPLGVFRSPSSCLLRSLTIPGKHTGKSTARLLGANLRCTGPRDQSSRRMSTVDWVFRGRSSTVLSSMTCSVPVLRWIIIRISRLRVLRFGIAGLSFLIPQYCPWSDTVGS